MKNHTNEVVGLTSINLSIIDAIQIKTINICEKLNKISSFTMLLI